MLDFKRTHDLKCNVLVLGKNEYKVFQSEDSKKEFFRTGALEDGMKLVDGDIEQIWSMRVCRINVDSMVKAGHVV
jgi:hypothetical protein